MTDKGPTKEDARQAEEALERQEHKFLWLLGALIAMLVLSLLIPDTGAGDQQFGFVGALILAAAIYAAGGTRRLTIVALVLGLPGVIARILSVFVSYEHLALATEATSAVFLGFVVWVMLSAVLTSGKVTRDKMAGAVCVYMLLGVLWSSLYRVVLELDETAFNFPAEMVERVDANPDRILGYFSFVTLTTLGYGDITPRSQRARTLAWAEAVTGQLFIAITIARLVGLAATHSAGRD